MKIRKIAVLLLSLLMLLSLAGCAASSKANMGYGNGSVKAPEAADTAYSSNTLNDYTASESKDPEAPSKEDSTSVAPPENRKLIQTIRISAETEDMDALLSQLNARIAEYSGYVEGQNIYNGSAYSNRRYRNAELTIRVPAASVENFLNQVSQISNVVSSNKTVEDITLKYVSTESRMKALQTEEARLLELLAKAETMDDLLTIEKYLTEVRSELEMVTSSLRVYDNRVDYATVYLSVSEVKEYTVVSEPETVWERIGEGFSDSMKDLGTGFENFFVFIVVNIPYFVLLAAIITVVVLLLRLRKKKKAKKSSPNTELKNN